jgi:hypothetical protein
MGKKLHTADQEAAFTALLVETVNIGKDYDLSPQEMTTPLMMLLANAITLNVAHGSESNEANCLEDQAIRFMTILQRVYKAASPRMRDSIQDVQARQIRERVNEIFNQD